jgi:hypothetical protein
VTYAVSALSSSEDRRHARSRSGGEGKPTDDAARAVRGELVEHDEQSKQTRRVWYRLEQVEIKWLPVSEASFLLWVLVALLAVWLAIGVALGLV